MACPACGARAGEGSRFCPMCGSPLGPQGYPRETRKSVTILFIDIVGSTALAERLDPEPLRQVMDRYFAGCQSSITDHGGVVEKFIGDAVMAVFGAPVAHEDDAVRAVRAAAGSLTALRDLSAGLISSHQITLEARCGICSGEVVVTAAGGDYRVVGDAVNTASRLQTAARPGEILICATTAAMARGHAGIERVPPLRLKGKAEPVQAWRVTGPLADAGHDLPDPAVPAAPLIGRDDELAELRQSFRRVTRRQQVCLVTVVGAPGMGKSRLVREFLVDLDSGAATVMAGQCSAYGKGITYAPLADMLRACPGGWAEVARLLLARDDDPGRRAAGSLSTIVAEPGDIRTGGAVGVEEIARAVRCLLDLLGKARPVVMVWEDLHWAEETLLDLIDEIATWLTDVPVLLLCLARTELLEARPSWGGGKPCAMNLELGPLTHEHSAELVSELVARAEVRPHALGQLCEQVAARCDGNPLFAELMLDVFAAATPDARLPPTIQAVLGARLDQLPADEREVLEMAATIGRDFTTGGLEAVAAAERSGAGQVSSLLSRLARRRLVQRAGPGGFRFTQALLRDTAYASIPKARRERWHLLLAEWFAGRQGEVAAGQDPLAFARHVEAACLLRRDLVPGGPALPPLAPAAAEALAAEGMDALNRKDLPAATVLLERARELLPAGDSRHVPLALHICDAWIGLWDEPRARAALSFAEAALAGNRRARVTCAIQGCIVTLRLAPAVPATVAAQLAGLAGELDGTLGDDLSWCRYHQARAYLHLTGERAAAADASLRFALDRARGMADEYEEERLLCAICEVAQWTPHPVAGGLELCDTLSQRFGANRVLLVPVLVTRAYLAALGGQLSAARRALDAALAHTSDLHLDRADAAVLEMSGIVESLAGAPEAAEKYYRRAAAALRVADDALDARMLEAAIARAQFDQGKTAEAAQTLGALEAEDADLSLRTRIVAGALRGRIASARGCHEVAISQARRTGELSSGIDDPCLAGAALFDLAVVLRAAGRPAEAAAAGTSALERFTAKGATWSASQVREWLAGGGANG